MLSGPASVQSEAVPHPRLLAEAAELISRAERPVLVAGSGVFYAQAEDALAAFASATSMPVVVPIWDRGSVNRAEPWFMGVVGAASGGPRILPDADVVLLVGARVDYRVGFGQAPGISEGARIIRIDIDAGELHQGREPDIAMLADPASGLAAVTGALSEHPGYIPANAWLTEVRRRRDEFMAPMRQPQRSASGTTGRDIVQALTPLLEDDALFLIDGGNIGQWAHVLAERYPNNWLTCGASGVVGWGIAGAIAAKLTHPNRPVILLSGDGAIGFGLPELETAVRNSIPFVVVLADDRAWGSVATWQAKNYGPDGYIASQLGPVAYDMVARGFGARGERVEAADEIASAVRRGLDSGRPTLIHVPTVLGGPGDL
jgi:acetolactate synthase-1/2/3 large subunit